ncbi:MAG TPA: toll/interleukin-1 receptor domain-containing protein [Fluviicola sp.]|nr:toll/interleukin-1 receptor domain-containing protein [Fluviicola sp.]
MKRIFLSHSSLDKQFVRQINHRLIENGLSTWLDEAEIKIGDSLLRKISEAIDDIDFVLAFISENSIKSRWVELELEIAMTQQLDTGKVIVLPIFKDKVELPPNLKYLIGRRYCDLSNKERFEQEFVILLRTLGIPAGLAPDKSNLSQFEYLDVVICENEIFSIATKLNGTNNFLINPDGKKYFEKFCYLIHISKEGEVSSCMFSKDICVGHGTLELIDNHVHVFVNYKLIQGSYSMNGTRYVIRKNNLTAQFVREELKEDNWGFYPVILDKDTIQHFSFNNYHDCLNSSKGAKIQPFEAEERYLKNVSNHSKDLLPSSNEKIVSFLNDHINQFKK